MLLEMLRHPETLLPLVPKYSLHSLVRSEELLVFRILGIEKFHNTLLEFLAEELTYLQVLLLEISPQLLDHLRPGHLQKVLT